MNDKEIRRTLIEYLRIQYRDCRIYQEKAIGNSFCDVMMVTGELSGFEIKSDSDNYDRLPEQVKSYSRFFDRNYLVVGISHAKSASLKIPPEWGILVAEQDKIYCQRIARNCSTVNRRSQLTLLWKIELNNLLLRNSMPPYAQKSKAYICDVLDSHIPKDILGVQIADELRSRDEYNDETSEIYSDDFPAGEIVDRLSEEDLAQFTLDEWMGLYKRAVERKRQKEETVKLAIQERTPMSNAVPYSEISVSLGVPWISDEIISQFAIDVLKVPQRFYYQYDKVLDMQLPYRKVPIVRHEPITGFWHVEKYKDQRSPELTVIYGTARFNAMQILDCTLNLREIKIYDGSVFNEAETLAAIEKQEHLHAAFRDWIWKDADRRWLVEESYNKLFSTYGAPPQYDGSRLVLADMNEGYKLYDYQRSAVEHIISTPNTLLAYEVGAGKTFIMIAAAMEMRKSGLSRKNMFVVPNNIVGQWEKMFNLLYPKAKVLAVEPRSFSAEKRSKVLEQIKCEDYDGIIVAYSCFEMIPLSVRYLMRDMRKSLDVLESRFREINKIGFAGGAASIRRETEYINKTVSQLIDCMNASSSKICFDDLEINTLFVDEAHNYKNIPLRTCMKQIRGINAAGSRKCFEMLKKVRYVQESNGGRGVVFATGTPLCNSVSDVYAIQCYLQYDELKRLGIERFDNWVKTFARPEFVCEIDVDTSGFRTVERFREFVNLPELSKMFGQITVYHSLDKESLPHLSAYSDVVIPKSPELDQYMKNLYLRTEKIRSGDVDRKKDNMLRVSGDGRKAALSLKLVGKEEKHDEYSKLNHCASRVIDLYRKYPGCSQLVFCDYSVPKSEGFSVYKDIAEQLKREGIPASEIAFIHSFKTEEQKLKLFQDVNTGKKRVLFGSTFKLGIGANVQTRLKAIHHLDVPWRPADMVQREGRILRRGNENDEVFIYRYIVEGSFDSYSWQILQTKQHFISQFLSGTYNQRRALDLEEAELSYAQIKSLALSEPLMKEYSETENKLRRLRMMLKQEQEQTAKSQKDLSEIKEHIAALSQDLQQAEDDRLYISEHKDLLTAEIAALRQTSSIQIQDGDAGIPLGEFTLHTAGPSTAEKALLHIKRSGSGYYLELGKSFSGNITRLNNFFCKFDKRIEELRSRMKEEQAKMEHIERGMNYVSDTGEKIISLEKDLNAIFSKISQQ